MDIQNEDLLMFWAAMQKHEVRYMMIGGFATRFHGYSRNTDDVDIWLEDTIENRQKLRQVFIELEYGDLPNVETLQFIPGWTSLYIDNGLELDILTEMKGLENLSFQDCLAIAASANFDSIEVPFLHINHLIENKKATNRPKDQMDVMYLEKIQSLRNQQKK